MGALILAFAYRKVSLRTFHRALMQRSLPSSPPQ